VHINKGRLHPFQKMSMADLPDNDFHHHLRKAILCKHKLAVMHLCISIAFDWQVLFVCLLYLRCHCVAWHILRSHHCFVLNACCRMFLGAVVNGVGKEVAAAMDSKPLGIPKTLLLTLASSLPEVRKKNA
jgi:hypothetical protein